MKRRIRMDARALLSEPSTKPSETTLGVCWKEIGFEIKK